MTAIILYTIKSLKNPSTTEAGVQSRHEASRAAEPRQSTKSDRYRKTEIQDHKGPMKSMPIDWSYEHITLAVFNKILSLTASIKSGQKGSCVEVGSPNV